MKLYVAGPMTGLPELNFPAFNSAANGLRTAGHQVSNPAEINPDPATNWSDCMFRDLAALDACDGIVMLPGWQESPGAQIERLWAIRTGKQVYCATELHRVPA